VTPPYHFQSSTPATAWRGVCQLLNAVENANVGYQMGLVLDPGPYCVVIYDIGNVQSSDTFTLTATHT
jgi:hypothetical protein